LDPFLFVLIAVVVVLAGIGLVLFRQQGRAMETVFRRLAGELGGDVRTRWWGPPLLRIPHGECEIHVGGKPTGTGRGGVSSGSGGELAFAYATLPDAPAFSLEITRHGGSTLQPVEGGSAAFRRGFSISSDEPERAARLLCEPLEMPMLELQQRSDLHDLHLRYRKVTVYEQNTDGPLFAVRKTSEADKQPQVSITVAPIVIDATVFRAMIASVRAFADALRTL